MATSLTELKPAQRKAAHQTDLIGAVDRFLPAWLQVEPVVALFALLTGAAFLVLSQIPIWPTDVWSHVAYGEWIWKHGALPKTEPLMPLASGMPFVSPAWLSQLGSFLVFRQLGAPGLQFLHAATVTLCGVLLAWCCARRGRSPLAALAATGLIAWLLWANLPFFRPQWAGLVCFAALFCMLTSRKWRSVYWLGVPLIFVFWANLHGSFPVGLVMLGSFWLGRVWDVSRRSHRIGVVLRDRKAWRLFVLTELAAVAVLVNPYGLGLYSHVLSISGSANLTDLTEWDPLSIRTFQGQAAALVALVLLVFQHRSPRRVSVTEVLLVAGLGGCALWTARMLVWWAPVAVYYLVLHARATFRHRRASNEDAESRLPRRAVWAVTAVGLLAAFVVKTPLVSAMRDGRRIPLEDSVSRYTPVGAAEYLKQHYVRSLPQDPEKLDELKQRLAGHKADESAGDAWPPPNGQLFNSYEWGDYLQFAGPDGLPVFVATHAHLVPREVWRDYMSITELRTGWDSTLKHYGVNTIVLDRRTSGPLIGRLRRDAEWRGAYFDDGAFVFVRRDPI